METLRDQIVYLACFLAFQDSASFANHPLVIFRIEGLPQWGEPRRHQHVMRGRIFRLEPSRNGKIALSPGIIPEHLPQTTAVQPNPELVESELQRPIVVPPSL